ncbi:MAG TPA: response regulator [Thauera sp.]|nr:response regulator [Thauera sp.]
MTRPATPRGARRLRLPATLGGRLLLLGSLSLVAAASLVFALMSLQQQRLLRSEWAASLSAQAELIATNSMAAVSFGDAAEAHRLLSALSSSRFILDGRIVLADGSVFARHADEAQPRPGREFIPAIRPTLAGHVFNEHSITVWAPVFEGSRPVARVELLASLEQIQALSNRALRDSLLVLLGVLLVSLAFGWLLLRRLLAPVGELGALMHRLAADAGLPDRVRPRGGEEIAALGRGFNQLIDTIQARDAELAQYRGNLERLVEARTRALERAIADAREANRTKSSFLARMSHEIRTPMNAIVGLGRLLQRSRLSRPQRDQVDKMLASSESLLGIIDDVLDYSRIEAGKLSLESIPFEVGEVCQRALGVVALRAEEKGVELLFRCAADVPRRLIGDPLRLGQVLINLLGNAIKFTPKGEVMLALERCQGARGEAMLRFAVRDTGIGIDELYRGRLFEAFSQLDDSVTRRFGGTGLGLSICAQLVRMMDGSIEVDSEPGAGTVFRVLLPLALAEDAAAVPARAVSASYRRALVVDDNATAAALLVELLERLGLAARACASGEEGLEALQQAAAQAAFDLVLVDWQMPAMDGLQFAARIDALGLPGARPAVVLAITVGAYEAVAERLIRSGVDSVLVKPVTEAALLEALAEAANPAVALDAHGAGAGGAPDPAGLARIRGARVLIVDDLPLNREVVREFVSLAGLEVVEAANGREAIDRLAAGDIALVLMDVQMPVLDGLAATRLIRGDARHRDLPILAMTAHAMSGSRKQSLAAGMNDHLTKPIDPQLLYAALLKWIPPADYASAAVHAAAGSVQPARLPPLEGIDSERGLANHMGRPGLYRRILNGFREQFAHASADLSRALAQGEVAAARRLAHSLKSAAATIGATALSVLARRAESALQAGQRPEPGELAALAAELDRVLGALAPLASTAAPRPAGVADDLARAQGLLLRLGELLERHDAAAEGLVGELLECLHDEAQRARIDVLRELIEDIEYERALVQLDALRQDLERMN